MRILLVRGPAVLGLKGRSTIVVETRSGRFERAIRDVEAVLIVGRRVTVSSALLPVLAQHNVPVAFHSMDTIAIVMNPVRMQYNNYRKLQYTLPKVKALEIAAIYIDAKLQGMHNVAKYYGVNTPPPRPPPPPLDEEEYENLIRTWEAAESQRLWGSIISALKPGVLRELNSRYGFHGRRPRSPDPFNKTLSLMYAVLYSLATRALISAGLDPTYGFLHRTRYSTPLTFDYVEMFKPVAIHATINMINSDGLPHIDKTGNLTRTDTQRAFKHLYSLLTLRNRRTGKTPYHQITTKAFCLARHLEGRCTRRKLIIIWNRKNYK
ncbi:MAG: CRISPR-associated endonuclease Cas1 [Desulfurococcales archaeon]|nr:CRISPR-associated endonuclease Cas1 [Desulfurococcales archaeon]